MRPSFASLTLISLVCACARGRRAAYRVQASVVLNRRSVTNQDQVSPFGGISIGTAVSRAALQSLAKAQGTVSDQGAATPGNTYPTPPSSLAAFMIPNFRTGRRAAAAGLGCAATVAAICGQQASVGLVTSWAPSRQQDNHAARCSPPIWENTWKPHGKVFRINMRHIHIWKVSYYKFFTLENSESHHGLLSLAP